MLLAHDDDRGAETFCAWGKVVQTIFSRLWSAQQCRRCCVGGAHQKGRILVAATAVNALDRPLSCWIRADFALGIDQTTKGLRLHAYKHVLIRLQSSNHPFHGDFLRHPGPMLGRYNTRCRHGRR